MTTDHANDPPAGTALSREATLAGLRLSIREGMLVNVFVNLTGGVFLPAFTLSLGATPLQLGFLAAIPFLGNLAQLGGSYLVERLQQRKKIAVRFASLARVIWLPALVASVFSAPGDQDTLLHLVMLVVIGQYMFGAVSGVAWLSWMTALVPDEIRGRYFGLRNTCLGAAAIAATSVGGLYLDWHARTFPHVSPWHAFNVLFLCAIVAGVISLWPLRRQPEPPPRPGPKAQVRELYRMPFQRGDFRNLIRFGAGWSLAMNVAAPFFIVYCLRDLQLTYTRVAMFSICSALADLAGMWIWGHVSDRVGNKPVLAVCVAASALWPFVWMFTDAGPFSVLVLLPLLHVLGGFFTAGYNLCSGNLVYRLVPPSGNATFFASWAAGNGLSAALGALLGGFLLQRLQHVGELPWLPLDSEFKLVFLISGVLRAAAILTLRRVREPRGVAVVKVVRVLLNVRSWATMLGFHPALHYLLPTEGPAKTASPYWPIWRTPARSGPPPPRA